MPLGLYENPPPAGNPAYTYSTVGKSNATWFLYQTQHQASKWILWSRKIPIPLP